MSVWCGVWSARALHAGEARPRAELHRNVNEEVSRKPVKGRAGDALWVHCACDPARAAEPLR